ncbi:hypothetical protein M0R45_018301 [Rubus argutus]|uniref:Pentatricopeptide repeat-containing protein n=1 Tax=Rubus argutus TaxID=59490 RepID=A0AAW1X4N0_RUBAR
MSSNDSRKVADAMEMFGEMSSRRFVPTARTIASFMEPLCSYGPPYAAMMIYQKARKVGCRISLGAYKLLPMCLSRFDYPHNYTVYTVTFLDKNRPVIGPSGLNAATLALNPSVNSALTLLKTKGTPSKGLEAFPTLYKGLSFGSQCNTNRPVPKLIQTLFGHVSKISFHIHNLVVAVHSN